MQKGVWNPYLKVTPAQYLNQAGIMGESGKHIAQWGKRALVSGGKRALRSVEEKLFPSLAGHGITWEKHTFIGECCDANINLIKEKTEEFGADVLVAVGGGKSLDSAKAAAGLAGVPIVTIPTIAATCAAASATSIIYNEQGQYEKEYHRLTNPQLVLVDPEVIARAPLIYLKGGIFDSLAKWYEGKVIIDGLKAPNVFSSMVASLAEFLNERMTKQVLAGVKLARDQQVGAPLIDVIDLNICVASAIQGLGQPAFTGAAAHAIHNGLTLLEESHELLHGIKVGYGIVVMQYLEQKTREEIDDVVTLFRGIGLEPTFKGLNLPFTPENLQIVAERAAADEIMKKMPFSIDPEMVVAAMTRMEEELAD